MILTQDTYDIMMLLGCAHQRHSPKVIQRHLEQDSFLRETPVTSFSPFHSLPLALGQTRKLHQRPKMILSHWEVTVATKRLCSCQPCATMQPAAMRPRGAW